MALGSIINIRYPGKKLTNNLKKKDLPALLIPLVCAMCDFGPISFFQNNCHLTLKIKEIWPDLHIPKIFKSGFSI